MAGFGDYIHYTKENYKRFGTTLNGPSNYQNAQAVFEAQIDKMKRTVVSTPHSNKIKDLEKFLNSFLYGREIDGVKLTEEEWKKFEKRFYKQFDKQFANFEVLFDGNNKLQAYGKTHIDPESTSVSANRIKQYIFSLENNIKNMGKKGKASNEEIAQFNKAIDGLNQLLKQENKENGSIDLRSIPESKSILDEVNRVLKKITLPSYLATGSALEHFLAAAANYVDERAKIEGDKLVDQSLSKVVGQLGSASTISINQFSDYVDVNELQKLVSKTWKLNEHSQLEMHMATQDKLDVVMNWQGDQYNITAKNYYLNEHRNLRLVSGSPLISFINGENPDFVNHWLNTITYNKKASTAIQNYNLAHQAMKCTILVKALTGQGLGKQGIADTFIVNNRSKQKLHVFSTAEVIDKITKDLQKNASFSGYPDKIKNVWVGGNKMVPSTADAQARITNLMALIAGYKISASINYDKLV